jgi:Tol biopolymer transport system component
MALAAGTRLGPYEIKAPLGAGGMGEVWQATDTRLGRSVALKLLPDAFAADPARLERFEREAKLLAALSHANVAGLFALEEVRPDGAARPVRFLAMELVLGEDLAERLRRGPIAPDEAIEIARQIAEALEEAHEKGIVHRDLKPANVKVTPEGKVKVLDFGLAKAWSGDAASGSAPDLSQSPTLAHTGTAAGLILGTAGYMSPEQARGRAVDKRADVWAFGVVLFEMLSGRRLFEGETVSDTLAAVLRQEIDWSALPSSTPSAIRSLLHRCLEREPRKRLRDIGEARIALDLPLATDATRPSTPAVARRGAGLAWAIAAASLAAAVFFGLRSRKPEAPTPPLLQLDVQFAEDVEVPVFLGSRIALAPDGKRLCYVATASNDTSLYLRPLDQPTATSLANASQARQPFFSPDGSEIGFFTGNEIRRVSVGGGASNVIAEVAADARGASWGDDGTIVFVASQQEGLYSVAASGGKPEPLTKLDSAKGERSHRWPSFVPGTRKVVFNVQSASRSFDESAIELLDLDSGKRTPLGVTGAMPRYADGRLLFVRDARLLAAPLDVDAGRLVSPPVVLADGVDSDPRNGTCQYAVARSGLLAYVPGRGARREGVVTWTDRSGRATPFIDRPNRYLSPRFSPDGSKLVLQIGPLGHEDIYVASAAGGPTLRLTFDDLSDASPIWSPDGAHIAYASVPAYSYVLNVKNADGSGEARQVYEAPSGHLAIPTGWSPDGRTLLIQESGAGSAFDVLALDLASGKTRPIVTTTNTDSDGTFSPDGRFVAYSTGTQGRTQVFVRTLAEGGGQWQLSTDGGFRPVWLKTGEIVYQQQGRPTHQWISVPVRTTAAGFQAGTPKVLFRARGETDPLLRVWDVTPDGQRFALIQPVGAAPDVPGVRVRMVFGWTRLLASPRSGSQQP